MEHYQLSETIGAGMESRFYINGKRVSRADYQAIKERAYSIGRLECFHTRAWTIRGGKTRRTNYSIAYC